MTTASVTTRSVAPGATAGAGTTVTTRGDGPGATAGAGTTGTTRSVAPGATTGTATAFHTAPPASHPRRTDVRPSPARPARPVPPAATLASWGARIAADGMRAHEDLAREVVAVAAARGLCPVLVDVLADPAEPTVARERAFGRLAQALARLA